MCVCVVAQWSNGCLALSPYSKNQLGASLRVLLVKSHRVLEPVQMSPTNLTRRWNHHKSTAIGPHTLHSCTYCTNEWTHQYVSYLHKCHVVFSNHFFYRISNGESSLTCHVGGKGSVWSPASVPAHNFTPRHQGALVRSAAHKSHWPDGNPASATHLHEDSGKDNTLRDNVHKGNLSFCVC